MEIHKSHVPVTTNQKDLLLKTPIIAGVLRRSVWENVDPNPTWMMTRIALLAASSPRIDGFHQQKAAPNVETSKIPTKKKLVTSCDSDT